jgi:plasmid stability protein
MSKMIQLRNVPDEVHRTLRKRAVDEGTTLSEYLVREVTRLAERPTLDEVLVRIRKRRPVRVTEPAAAAVRAEREARE